MTFREKTRLTVRGYRTIRSLVPGYLPTVMAQSALSAFLPFVNIFMPAKIITALAEGGTFRSVFFLVMATVVLNLVTTLVSSGMRRLQSYYEAKFRQLDEQPLDEKIQRMDYERVEDTATHLKKEHIWILRQTRGLGLPQLVWCCTGLLSGVFTVLFSVSLLSGAFTSFHSRPAGGCEFLFSPWAAPAAVVLIAANITVNIRFTRRSMRKQEELFAGFLTPNRMGNYYYKSLMTNYSAGKDIKLYAMDRPILKEYGKLNGLVVKMMGRWQKIVAGGDSAVSVSNTVLTGVVYAYVAVKALFGSFGVGSIVQYVGCLSQLSGGVSSFMTNLSLIGLNAETLKLFFEFIDMPDRKYQGTIPVEKRGDNEYEIEFRNVSFRYPGSDACALKNLSMKLRVGQRLAVVGRNGSGKTTMIKLLCRLYDPTEGEITLNGIDIKKYDYAEYLSLFGVVFQDFKLFSFGLGQNVAASVEYDGERAAEALKKAGFGERLSTVPEGLDTPLYKDFEADGVEISGGEAQKIALARALYKDAPFIVLDEPTAALDPIAEYEIYSKFNEIVGGKTAVFISHRLSSCRFCDDIAVFHEGRLIQRGSHDSLLRDAGGQYSKLWNAQAQYYTDDSCGQSFAG